MGKCTRADRCQNIMIEGMGSSVSLMEQSCLFWASDLPLVLMLFIVYFDVIFNWMENELFVSLFGFFFFFVIFLVSFVIVA